LTTREKPATEAKHSLDLGFGQYLGLLALAHDVGSFCMKINNSRIIISVINEVEPKWRYFPTEPATDKLINQISIHKEPDPAVHRRPGRHIHMRPRDGNQPRPD
jgi:hypothetical protein